MANKAFRISRNEKKKEGENKKKREKTEYQRERDAMKGQKRHRH